MSNKNLYLKLIGFLTKKGNKSKALKIVNSAFLNVSDKTGLSFSEISLKLFDDLKFIKLQKPFNKEFSFNFSEGCQSGLFIKANLALIKLS